MSTVSRGLGLSRDTSLVSVKREYSLYSIPVIHICGSNKPKVSGYKQKPLYRPLDLLAQKCGSVPGDCCSSGIAAVTWWCSGGRWLLTGPSRLYPHIYRLGIDGGKLSWDGQPKLPHLPSPTELSQSIWTSQMVTENSRVAVLVKQGRMHGYLWPALVSDLDLSHSLTSPMYYCS